MSGMCELPRHQATDQEVERILQAHRVVAVVGLSPKPHRDSFQVARYLQEQGYTIIPVNPNCREVLGERCYPSLADVPTPVDIVDIFRKPEAVPEIVEAAIAARAKVIWMQLGIVHNEAADKALAHGLDVVMGKCIKVEHMRTRSGKGPTR